MSNHNKKWTQQDFSQFYDEQPKIQTSPTYVTIHILIHQQNCYLNTNLIDVKIPTYANQQVIKFLLFKALYFYYLDCKAENPLYKTAQVSFFQSVNGYGQWYNLWSKSKQIGKKNIFKIQKYTNVENIQKYLFLASKQEYKHIKILSRSRKNGNYYNIYVYNTEQVQNIVLLHQNYLSIQHPFLSHLYEYHQTDSKSYFIFQHQPLSFSQVFMSNTNKISSQFKINSKQLITYFLQILLAIIYLQKKQTLTWKINFEMIMFGFDGHLIVSQDVVSHFQDQFTEEGKGNQRFGKNQKWQFLKLFLNILKENSQLNSQEKLQMSKLQQYISIVSIRKSNSFKQILNFPLLRQNNIHNILSKTSQVLDLKKLKLPQKSSNYKQLTHQQQQSCYLYQNQLKLTYKLKSYKISPKTSNEKILKKYQTQKSTIQTISPLNQQKSNKSYLYNKSKRCSKYQKQQYQNNQSLYKSNSSSSLIRKNSKQLLNRKLALIQQQSNKKRNVKQPYYGFLNKQCTFYRKKKLNG